MRKLLYGLLALSFMALGAVEGLKAAPGDAVLTTLSGSYLMPVDAGGPLNNVTSITTLAAFIGGSAVATNITSSSATAFSVGPNGTTGPGFVVDASVSSAAAGLKVTGLASGSGVKLDAVGGTNEPIFVSGKGTGAVLLGGTTTTLAGLQIAQTASRVNDLNLVPGATGTNVILNASTAGADTNAGIDITPKGSGVVKVGGTIATCSGTTTATCQGQRFVASVTGLTTAAAGIESAAMTVTNASVISSSAIVICQVNGYAGTGVPIASRVIPGTGSVSFTITNVANSAALNATVAVACYVVGS